MLKEKIDILILNGGSSSIKFAVYERAEKLRVKYTGKIIRVGLPKPVFSVLKKGNNQVENNVISISNFKEAATYLLDWLEQQPDFAQIRSIGHRVVYGMEHTHSEILSDELIKELNQIRSYDPDHLPAELEIIQLCKKRFPGLIQVACFDTAFHATMPKVAKRLPIPRHFKQAGIRRYGFHGLSYTYLLKALKELGEANEANGRVILAHLGNGASITAVKNGQSMDTSMGFTPTGGLVMGTRSGDIDPGLAWHMMQNEGMTAEQFKHLINHESGLLGIAEISSDMQELWQLRNLDIRAAEAIELFCYQIKKWMGAFTTVLGGLDTLVFSGGIGENSAGIRAQICEGLTYLGIELIEEQNHKNALLISAKNSKVKVRVITTNEEFIMAESTNDLFEALNHKKRQYQKSTDK